MLSEDKLDRLENKVLSSLEGEENLVDKLMELWQEGFALGEKEGLSEIFEALEKDGKLTYATPNEAIVALRKLKPRGLGDLKPLVLAKLAKVVGGIEGEPDRGRMLVVVRTELTQAVNKGLTALYQRTPLVSHVVYSSILDKATTGICKSRDGMVVALGSPDYKANQPALHYNCRSYFRPLLPSLVPKHKAMVQDPGRKPENRLLAPLLPGWRSDY